MNPPLHKTSHPIVVVFLWGGMGGGGVLSFSSLLQAYANNLYHSWCANIVNLSISHNEHQASGERPFLMGVGAEGGLLLHTPGLSFQQSSSKLGPNWLCHWRGIAWFHTSVYQNWNLGTKTAASTESQSKHLLKHEVYLPWVKKKFWSKQVCFQLCCRKLWEWP